MPRGLTFSRELIEITVMPELAHEQVAEDHPDSLGVDPAKGA